MDSVEVRIERAEPTSLRNLRELREIVKQVALHVAKEHLGSGHDKVLIIQL